MESGEEEINMKVTKGMEIVKKTDAKIVAAFLVDYKTEASKVRPENFSKPFNTVYWWTYQLDLINLKI